MSTHHEFALRKGLATAIAAVGGNRSELWRRILNVTTEPLSKPAVYQWEHVPLDRVSDVARATGVPKHILRPDQHDPPAAQTIGESSQSA